MNPKKILALIAAIVGCNLAGGLGSLFTAPAIPTWYATLNKPFFNPPSWIFAPVWTLLFTLMGISLFLIINQPLRNQEFRLAIKLFLAQLVLNVLWSVIFFGNQNPGLAFAEIILLIILVMLTIVQFYPLSKKASYLLLPYFVWILFASILSYTIWQLNS